MRIDSVRYARAGDVDVAYQVYGDGPLPVVAIPGAASCVEMMFELAQVRPWLDRWGAFATVAQFDKRGTGQSDRVIGAPSIDERMDDIRAVMDAAGFERAALYGLSEGGPMALLFAATYPERTSAIVLQGTFARMPVADDYPIGRATDELEWSIDQWASRWGSDESITLHICAPSVLARPDKAEIIAFEHRWERASASPRTLRDILHLGMQIDVRHVLSAVRCPTLVLHARRDLLVPRRYGEYLAENIADARLHVYDGEHWPTYTAVDEQMDVVEEFLTGHLGSAPVDRVLATVLFTDIVDSTARAAAIGDHAWREILEHHDRTMMREIERHRGRRIKTTGDGVLATFDSPARAIRCAQAAAGRMHDQRVELRAGLHTGEVELRGDDVAGIAVHLAARVAALADGGEVLVSGAVPPLVVGSGLSFTDRGTHELKGVPGQWALFSVD